MGYKVLAAHHPGHGQQGCRSALNELTVAGHLRRVKEHLTLTNGSMRWVTRTYWTPVARSDEWWAAFVRSVDGIDVTAERRGGLVHVRDEAEEPAPAEPKLPAQPVEPARSTAYNALAQLGDTDPQMTLSAAECDALEPLAAEWLARGATPEHLIRTLTSGLPQPVRSAGALARNRLETKMPPKKTPKATGRARVTRVIMACMGCDEDERTTSIIDGLCLECFREEQLEPVLPDLRKVPATFLPAHRQPGYDNEE
ncbi:hypothetical protein [Streptomyces sp. BPTC-684]|uniref:hypothetical protein n=1 Tax=Streptomyces sp. BPTC-684 TaxID=3043734 RepID=UPI0024B09F6F|nr:hypothetical protein [Streptomyces sp. BPTC-684]WHM37989.1 hypothetical protein QIY60_14430 [Streptomyces sp. BPTC-684]